eukprot:4784709-Lingulodinium_polyedra.AAC.1
MAVVRMREYLTYDAENPPLNLKFLGKGGTRARDWTQALQNWRVANQHLMEVDPITGRKAFSSKIVV